MANIILLNNLQRGYDPTFIKIPGFFVANDATARPILGSEKLRLATPPLSSERAMSAIDGSDLFQELDHRSTVYTHYSDVDKGQIQYFIDTDRVDPFKSFMGSHITMKRLSPNGIVEYTRQATNHLSSRQDVNQWFIDTQLQREDIQALQMRPTIRSDYIPYKLF